MIDSILKVLSSVLVSMIVSMAWELTLLLVISVTLFVIVVFTPVLISTLIWVIISLIGTTAISTGWTAWMLIITKALVSMFLSTVTIIYTPVEVVMLHSKIWVIGCSFSIIWLIVNPVPIWAEDSIWMAVEIYVTTVDEVNSSVLITVSIYYIGFIVTIWSSIDFSWIVVILVCPPAFTPVSKPSWTMTPVEPTKVIWPSNSCPICTPGTMVVD